MFGFLKNRGSKDSKADAPKPRKGRDGFYMEFDESKAQGSENGKQAAKAEPVKVEPAPKPAAKAEPAPVEAAKVEAPAAATGESVKAKKSEAKSKRAKALSSAAKTEKKTPEAGAKPEPAKPAVAAASNGQVAAGSVKTFAPDYLLTLTSSNGRRRPGANMNSYLEMARQVKTRG